MKTIRKYILGSEQMHLNASLAYPSQYAMSDLPQPSDWSAMRMHGDIIVCSAWSFLEERHSLITLLNIIQCQSMSHFLHAQPIWTCMSRHTTADHNNTRWQDSHNYQLPRDQWPDRLPSLKYAAYCWHLDLFIDLTISTWLWSHAHHSTNARTILTSGLGIEK